MTAVVGNFDQMLDLKVVNCSHKKKSSVDDINAILQALKTLDLWQSGKVRSLNGFRDMKRSPFAPDKNHLFLSIQKTTESLKRYMQDMDDESDEEGQLK
ncbi:hypothetical protein KP79_PYT02149 [Mizuhopecten yessoensis]|uniref:Uncharacterized protein n=1 Tax=Mizuhopecten yessoensis TaxID=6573 RepID=A0A210PYX1_MIZYE|nr:hypothetical protein KP79_PYT02149 [Mizuhopecten yessoensis]